MWSALVVARIFCSNASPRERWAIAAAELAALLAKPGTEADPWGPAELGEAAAADNAEDKGTSIIVAAKARATKTAD